MGNEWITVIYQRSDLTAYYERGSSLLDLLLGATAFFQ